MVEHAPTLINRFQLGRDGRTPFRKLRGKDNDARVCEFGEQVLAKIVKRRGKHRLKNQMEAQFFQGTWVGIHMRTNEHIVVRASDGKALRARTVRCNKQGEQWSKEAVMNIKATPMNPDPANPRYETPEAAGKLEIDTDNKTGDQLPRPHNMSIPRQARRSSTSRKLYLDNSGQLTTA